MLLLKVNRCIYSKIIVVYKSKIVRMLVQLKHLHSHPVLSDNVALIIIDADKERGED